MTYTPEICLILEHIIVLLYNTSYTRLAASSKGLSDAWSVRDGEGRRSILVGCWTDERTRVEEENSECVEGKCHGNNPLMEDS